MKIVLATNNNGKAAEVADLCAGLTHEVISQAEFQVPDIEETGLTFVENAILKARNACAYSKLPAIGDDSGLEIDALNGAPGIYSARYAGEHGNSGGNIAKVLEELQGVPEAKRTARFRTVMVLLRHEKDPAPLICQGVWEGRILTKKQGVGGFGYDPIFFVPTHNCSAAELDLSVKNQLSHRGQALQQLLQQLANI